MPGVSPVPITPSARRARAAAAIRTLTGAPALTTLVVADALDLSASGILAAVGIVEPAEARSVLLSLWAEGS